MDDTGRNNVRGAGYALAAMGVYATHDVIIKTLGAHYSAFQIVFFAALLSFPLVTLILVRDRTGGVLIPVHPWWTALRTICAVITGTSAFYAFSVLPLAQTYALLFATPLLVTIFSIPILGEKVHARRWAAVVVGLIGVLIVLRPGSDTQLGWGHAAGILSALTASLAACTVRKIARDERPVVLLLFPLLGNFLAMACIMPFVYVPVPIGHMGLWAIVACMALVGAFLQIRAYSVGEAVIVAPMQYSQILWATAYGYLLFDETPDRFTLLGAGVIIASGIYIVLRERSNPRSLQPVMTTEGKAQTLAPRPPVIRRILGWH